MLKFFVLWKASRLLGVAALLCAALLTLSSCGQVPTLPSAASKSALSTTSASTSAQSVTAGTVYEIVNRNSGLVLDVANASTSNGANVQQYSYWGGTNQQWSLVDVGSGYYKIQNANSGMVLDVANASTSNGANVQQYSYWGGTNQQWSLVDVGSGYYKIQNVNSGLVLDVANQSTSDGANIQQYSYWGGTNQQWSLVATSSSSGSGSGSSGSNTMIGRFSAGKDLLISHHDNGTDLDDSVSIAAEATFLTTSAFQGVKSFLVAGTVQKGYNGFHYDASSEINLAYPNRWADAFANWTGAVSQEASLVESTLNNGGNVWIAEGGSSDFTSDVVNKVKADDPTANTKAQIHVVQSSTYNQNNITTPSSLQNVQANTNYILIPSEYAQYTTSDTSLWAPAMSNSRVGNVWTADKNLINQYNGHTGYNDPDIYNGGMAMEDTTEMDYIFEFNEPSVQHFFQDFLN